MNATINFGITKYCISKSPRCNKSKKFMINKNNATFFDLFVISWNAIK